MTGICGTCARPAEATSANEGYSDCCNDRIEYGEEAAATVRRATCQHTSTRTITREGHDERVGFYAYRGDVVCADCGERMWD